MPFPYPPHPQEQHAAPPLHMTTLRFASGVCVVAPTDQWIAFLFDALHPSQQDGIIERIKEMAEAQQQDKPLIEVPGFYGQPGSHLRKE